MQSPSRDLRRHQERRVSARRRQRHLQRIHGGSPARVDCACELSATYFAKQSGLGCTCRKRRRGRPRLACGLCTAGSRERIYRWRREARELDQRLSRSRHATRHRV